VEPINQLTALACPLPLENVDTDQLIPARFMKEPRLPRGYGDFLLHDMRFDRSGSPADFVLNRPGMDQASILVARRNFGAGSSREAAVYALVDFGFRCVVAPGFGDIFASNAVNNGLLPAQVSEPDAERLLAQLEAGEARLSVNLDAQTVGAGDVVVGFDINPTWRLKLLNGWDDIDLTLAKSKDIEAFRAGYLRAFPWLG